MDYTRLKKVVVSSLLSGSMMLSVGITANAMESNSIKDSGQYRSEIIQENKKAEPDSCSKSNYHNQEKSLNQVLDSLVKDGSLKKERAETIKDYVKKNAENKIKEKGTKKFQRTHVMGKLLKDNVITKEEAKLIFEKAHKLREEKLAAALNNLVERKVITEAKSEEIKIYLKKASEERKNEFNKIKSMTEEERREYFKNNKKERKNIFSKMVEDGIVTKEQNNELKKEIKASM